MPKPAFFARFRLLTIQDFPHRFPICFLEGRYNIYCKGVKLMGKREIIDFIMEINKSAKPEFLAQFPIDELDLYLEHLMETDLEEVCLCA